MDESDTRLIPYDPEEVAWARRRPPDQRTPLPGLGEAVLYRHDPWGPLMDATVEEVLDDPADASVGDHNPDVWEVQRDQVTGKYLMTHGQRILVRKADPWPQIRLVVTGPRRMIVTTQEARLRGSPGWLPLDWETRHRPIPGFIEVKGGHR